MENTTLGIPALIQSEGLGFYQQCLEHLINYHTGLHGFTNNGTTWPSPIALASSFNTALLQQAAATIADEAEGLGVRSVTASSVT